MLAAGKPQRQYLYSIRNICKDRKEMPLGCKTLKSTTHILQTFMPLLKHAAGSVPISIAITPTRPHLCKGSHENLTVYYSFSYGLFFF